MPSKAKSSPVASMKQNNKYKNFLARSISLHPVIYSILIILLFLDFSLILSSSQQYTFILYTYNYY